MKKLIKLIFMAITVCVLAIGTSITALAAANNSTATICNEVIRLVNVERGKYGIRPLSTNVGMQRVAAIRAAEQREYFSHTRPDGRSFDTAYPEGGIYERYGTKGENIAQGQLSPAEVMNSWMNSPGHRQNILNRSYDIIGVGYDAATNSWVQVFLGYYRR